MKDSEKKWKDSILIQEEKKEVGVSLLYFNIIFFIIDLIIDHSYSQFMKFSDVLYDGALPNNQPLAEALTQKEKKKQQKSGFGFGI